MGRCGTWKVGLGSILCACLGAGAVLASPVSARSPICDVSPAPIQDRPGAPEDVATLIARLEEREAELRALRAELSLRDESALHEEAEALGIVDAVKASRLPERQQRRIAVAIVREARLHGLDPLLVVAVIRTESAFDSYAVSPAGAMGLMQVMPATGRWLVERRGEKLGRTTHLFDPELNIELGTSYLAELIEQFGSVDEALVAYNAGPNAAKKILRQRSSRARFMAGYPRKVLREFSKLRKEAEARIAVKAQRTVPDDRS